MRDGIFHGMMRARLSMRSTWPGTRALMAACLLASLACLPGAAVAGEQAAAPAGPGMPANLAAPAAPAGPGVPDVRSTLPTRAGRAVGPWGVAGVRAAEAESLHSFDVTHYRLDMHFPCVGTNLSGICTISLKAM